MKNKLKNVTIGVGLLGLLVGCQVQSNTTNKEINALRASKLTVEYGSVVKPENLIIKTSGTIVNIPKIDTYKIGESEVILSVDGVEQKIKLTIVDTKIPEIKGPERIESKVGTDVDFNNTFSAGDLVDGALPVKIEGTFDKNTEGEYKLRAVTEDKNGNTYTKEFTLVYKKVTQQEVQQAAQTTVNNNQQGGAIQGGSTPSQTTGSNNTQQSGSNSSQQTQTIQPNPTTPQPKPNPTTPQPTPNPVTPKPTPQPSPNKVLTYGGSYNNNGRMEFSWTYGNSWWTVNIVRGTGHTTTFSASGVPENILQESIRRSAAMM